VSLIFEREATPFWTQFLYNDRTIVAKEKHANKIATPIERSLVGVSI